MRGEPQSALERACFWVEYVARHKGAQHLRSAAQYLTWYQNYLIDVTLFLFVAVSVKLIAMLLAARFVLKKILGAKHGKTTKVSHQRKNK